MKAIERRRRLAKREGFDSPGDLVFPTTTGTIFRKSNLNRRWWQPLLEKAQVTGIRIHDLRHTSASLSLLAGTSAKVVADKLGHSDPGFTSRVYAHAVESLHQRDADASDAIMKASRRRTRARSAITVAIKPKKSTRAKAKNP